MCESLDKLFVMTRASNVDFQKRFPVVQMDSMFQGASACRSSAQIADFESLLVDWEREKTFHYNSIPLPEKFSGIIQIIHPLLQLLYL